MLDLNFYISMWNYEAYTRPWRLEDAVHEVVEAGYGIELWPWWKDQKQLFAPENRERLKNLLRDVPSSLHSGEINGISDYFKQIDAAADTGSSVLVVHAPQLQVAEEPDFGFAREVVAYGREKGVLIALENGELTHLARAVEELDDLVICLDTGHVYCSAARERPMQEFVDALKWRIRHLHLQDVYLKPDTRIAVNDSHRTPGYCDIPREDYEYLLEGLSEVGFTGAAVLEVRPFTPVEIAQQSKLFFESLSNS